jgi:hypothetical protein
MGKGVARDPKTAVLSAVSNVFAETEGGGNSLAALYKELVNGNWYQDYTFGINRIDLGGSAVDASIQSLFGALPMFTVKNTSRGSMGKIENNLSVNMAVTPLASVYLYGDADKMGVNVPQAFDYLLTIDPRRISEEINASMFADYSAPMDETAQEEFYKVYSQMINRAYAPQTADTESIRARTQQLAESAAYTSEGKESYSFEGKEYNGDVYNVTIPAAELNAYFRDVTQISIDSMALTEDIALQYTELAEMALDDISFNQDVSIKVYVVGENVARLDILTGFAVNSSGEDVALDGDIYLHGDTASLDKVTANLLVSDGMDDVVNITVEAESQPSDPDTYASKCEVIIQTEGGESGAEDVTLSWDVNWDKSGRNGGNFLSNLNFSAGAEMSMDFNITGTAMVDYENKIIEADLTDVSLALTGEEDVDMSFNIKYLLREDSAELGALYSQPFSGEKPLSELTELDVSEMYMKILEDPQIGPLLSTALSGGME